MNLEEIKEKHTLIRKKIEELDFGRVFLEFMTNMSEKGYKWIEKFLMKYNYNFDDKERREKTRLTYFFSKLLMGEEFYFVNVRNISETLIEIDILTSKTNLFLFSKIERKIKNNITIDAIEINFSIFKDIHEDDTPLSYGEGVARLNNIFDRLREKKIFSGNIGITQNEKWIFKRSLGEANMRYHVSNNIDTKFNLGSMNKIFTAVAVLQLYERKKLDLFDTIVKFLPDFPNGDKITIHHLLSHTSGLGSFWNQKFEERFKRIRSIDDYIDLFIKEDLLFQPGERFEYSNAGYIVLGKIIEVITRNSYDEYVQEHIFDVVGMKNTFCYEIDRIVPNLAMGYTHTPDDDHFCLDQFFNNFLIVPVKGSSAGGGYSTIDDLILFAKALKNGELISERSLELMQEPYKMNGMKVLTENYGYGCQTGIIENQSYYGHGGGSPGTATMLMIFPKLNMIFVILTNWDPLYEIFAEEQVINVIKRMKSL